MEVIIHIGLHKTGTTTIQSSLKTANNKGLIKEFRYLNDEESNHSFIMAEAFGSINKLEYYRSLKTMPRGIPMYLDGKREAKKTLIEELNKAKASNIPLLISGEDICILHPSEVLNMKEFFSENGVTKFSIIGYIRDPESWSVSFAQQLLKEGRTTVSEILLQPPVPRYKDFFEKFIDIFGSETVKIIPFEKRRLKGACVVNDFLYQIGFGELYSKIDVLTSNESVTLQEIVFKDILRKHNTKNKNYFLSLRFQLRAFFRNQELPTFSLSRPALDLMMKNSSEHIDWAIKELLIEPSFFDKRAKHLSIDELNYQVDEQLFLDFIYFLKEGESTNKVNSIIELAIKFEKKGDIGTAIKLMQEALLLKPNKPITKRKLFEYNKLLENTVN